MTDVLAEPVYRDLDRSNLEREYSPSSCVPDLSVYLVEYARRSAMARRRMTLLPSVPYCRRPGCRLDFFPSNRPRAPLHVYVHGGYWQELSKDESAFAAPDFFTAGAAFAALGYGLAPHYELDEIVAMVRGGLWWLVRNATRLGVDPSRIHLSGSSAGAHLVAMALLEGWMPDGRHPADVFAGATLISGVYDLQPIRFTYVNEPLKLDANAALRSSPLYLLPSRLPPLIVARGANETTEFARQHDELVAALRARGADVTELVVPGRNHFDVVFDLAVSDAMLGRAVLDQMGLSRVVEC